MLLEAQACFPYQRPRSLRKPLRGEGGDALLVGRESDQAVELVDDDDDVVNAPYQLRLEWLLREADRLADNYLPTAAATARLEDCLSVLRGHALGRYPDMVEDIEHHAGVLRARLADKPGPSGGENVLIASVIRLDQRDRIRESRAYEATTGPPGALEARGPGQGRQSSGASNFNQFGNTTKAESNPSSHQFLAPISRHASARPHAGGQR
jgi:hypothetical protein